MFRSIIVCACVFVCGCASNRDNLDRQLAQLEAREAQLDAETTRLEAEAKQLSQETKQTTSDTVALGRAEWEAIKARAQSCWDAITR